MQIYPIEILLIDDNAADIQHIQHLFRDCKINNSLDIIPDANNALKYLKHEDHRRGKAIPDLIMASFGLQSHGQRVIQTLRDDMSWQHIPRIVLFNSEQDSVSFNRENQKGQVGLAKPFTAAALFEAVLRVNSFGLSIKIAHHTHTHTHTNTALANPPDSMLELA